MNLVKSTLLFAVLILVIDIPWIYFYMGPLYEKNNLSLQMNLISAMIAYFIMIISFPLLIYDKNKNVMIKRAFYLGLAIYGTYGFTLAAIFPKYGLNLAIRETLWGMFLYTIVTKLTIMCC